MSDITLGVLIFSGIVIICIIVGKHLPPITSAPRQINQTPPPSDGFIPTVKPLPLSGTFICESCGGPTSFHDEVNPATKCQYCGAPLPEVRDLIEKRDYTYHEAVEQEHKHYTERILQNQKAVLEQKQMEYKHEQLLVREREEESKRQHRENIYSMIGVIVLIIIICLILASRRR